MTSTPTVGHGLPFISVIVPTYNRAAVLEKCLRALAQQTYDHDRFEVIVSDDGSTDATAEVCRHFLNGVAPRVVYLQQANTGANRARNRAVTAARGPILLFINDDTIPSPDLVTEHARAHAEHTDEEVVVQGRVTIAPEFAASRLAMLHLDWAFAEIERHGQLDWKTFFTCNVSLKKSFLAVVGGFEERIRYFEDLELAERLSHHGLRVVYNPKALGYHDHLLSEEEFLRTASREAKALVVWAEKAPQLRTTLGPLGFEPGLPATQRLRQRLSNALINDLTIPFWCGVARGCPNAWLKWSLRIYSRVYRAKRSSALHRELRQGRHAKASVTGVSKPAT